MLQETDIAAQQGDFAKRLVEAAFARSRLNDYLIETDRIWRPAAD